MNKPDVKKLILLNLPYVFAFYFADKIAAVFRLAPGTEFIDKLTNGFAVFGTTFANPLLPADTAKQLPVGRNADRTVIGKREDCMESRIGPYSGTCSFSRRESPVRFLRSGRKRAPRTLRKMPDERFGQ